MGNDDAPDTDPDGPAEVTTTLTDSSASASIRVPAPPSEVFEYLRNPANHAEISGDASVIAVVGAAEPLEAESRFRMRMKKGPFPYRITSKVVEFDRDRVIAWAHPGGHRWRWELEPDGNGGTVLTETYDQSTARFAPLNRLMGYPRGHVGNVADSVANVRRRFSR